MGCVMRFGLLASVFGFDMIPPELVWCGLRHVVVLLFFFSLFWSPCGTGLAVMFGVWCVVRGGWKLGWEEEEGRSFFWWAVWTGCFSGAVHLPLGQDGAGLIGF